MNRPVFLVSRTDRAGDLILTLPIFRELRKNYPECLIIAHVRKYTSPLLQLCPEVNKVINDDDFAPGTFCAELVKELKSCTPDQAIIVHPSARAIVSAWRAGIKKRTGRASNIWQILLNDRRVQKRSRNEKHEFCYNLDLLAGICGQIDYSPYFFSIPESIRTAARNFLASAGMQDTRPVVIHPGHGGSAFNQPAEKYAEMARELINHKIPVLVSFGPGEEKLKELFPAPAPEIFGFISDIPDLAILAGIFSECRAFVGGSTGPLHLAASLKIPCVAFFPPVRAMTPERWGPAGCQSLIIKPDLPVCDGQCKQCIHEGCMHDLSIEKAIAWLAQGATYESSH